MLLETIEPFWTHSTIKQYKPRSTIVYADIPNEMLYYVVEGTVSIAIESVEGKEIIIGYRHADTFIGETELYGSDTTSNIWAHAKTHCRIAEISFESFRKIAAEEPRLHTLVSQQMAKNLRLAARKIGNLVFYDVSGRVINTLLDLCKDPSAMTHPEGMQIKISRQEMSRIIGCSRERVGSVLKDLEARSLIEVHGHTIVVYGQR